MQLLQAGPGHVQPRFLPPPASSSSGTFLAHLIRYRRHPSESASRGPGRAAVFQARRPCSPRSCQASQMLRRGVCKTPRRCSKNMDCDQRPIPPLHIQFIWRPLSLPRREGGRGSQASKIAARGPGENKGAELWRCSGLQATLSPEDEAARPAVSPAREAERSPPPFPAPLVLLKHFHRCRLSAAT